MTIYTLPTVLVYIFSIGSVILLVLLIWTAQKRMASWEDRSKAKSKKIVEDYYDESEEAKKDIQHSAISSHLMRRWRQGLRDYDDL